MTQPSSQELKAIFGPITDTFYRAFFEAYLDRKNAKRFRGDLPMLTRRWCVHFVAAKRLWVILGYRPGYFSPASWEMEVVGQDDAPGIASLDDGESITDLIRLNDIADAIPFPLEPIPAQLLPVYLDQIRAWAVAWATKLADAHIARTNPSFDEAKERMFRAYEKLFELEHTLRLFVEQKLVAQYGSDWLNKATINLTIKTAIETRQIDRSGFWLDDLDSTVLRFIDFPMLRTLIMDNQGAFRSVLGPKERPTNWFSVALSSLEPLRNRIGHVNTLSTENVQDFYRDARRIIAAIEPEIEKHRSSRK